MPYRTVNAAVPECAPAFLLMPSSLTVETFRLHGLRIRAESDTSAVTQMLRETLRYKGALPEESATSPDLALSFLTEDSSLSVPDDARLHGKSEHCNIEIWYHQEQMYLKRGNSLARIRPEQRTVLAALDTGMAGPSETQRDPLFYFITFSLVILLRALDRFALHTAAMVYDGRGLLLVADSDSGKSTAALNLVRSGWDYVSDDTVLLRPTTDSVRADSFRRDFCLDPDAAGLFPELDDHEWPASPSDATKWRVDVDQLYPGQFVQTCIPHVLILPSIESRESSALSPISRRAMLGHLLREGAAGLVPKASTAKRHLDVLKQLVLQADAYRLHAGQDLIRDPKAASQLLIPVMTGEPV